MTKPPYEIPSMDEIRAVPDNGLRLVSTFSGAGGSCLGFRWAGYRTLWASEFVPAARETYAANFSDVPVSDADIRDVDAAELLREIGLDRGEIDVLEGSPPCASFSTAGKRSKHWGEVKRYSDREQRTDDLFFEFARLVDGLRPRVFVAENVAGLARGVAKGYFKRIHAALAETGYRVEARMLDAQWLGVPQTRRRIIFVGVREGLDFEPPFPKPLPYRYSIRDAIPWIVRQASNAPYGERGWNDADSNPSQTIGAGPSSGNGLSPPSLCEAIVGVGTFDGVRPLDEPLPTVQTHGNRYTHSELTAVVGRTGPNFRAREFTADEPIGAIWASGSERDQYETVERRKFTIAELRRLCGFPDDFVLTGTYHQQWERLGRAVPPPMMRSVAAALALVLSGQNLRSPLT